MLKSDPAGFHEAQKHAEHIAELVMRYLALQENKATFGTPEALELQDVICASVRPGIYEHFKTSGGNRKFYEVFEVVPHVNYQTVGHAFQVIYSASYPPMMGRRALRELLGADGFLTPVSKDGYIGPRFVYYRATMAT